MNITKENYESYLLDHIEGNLSTGQTSQLFQFLDKYPEFKAELAAYEQTILVPDERIVFKDKAQLKKRKPKVIYLNTRLLSTLAIAATLTAAFLLVRPLLQEQEVSPAATGVSQESEMQDPTTEASRENTLIEGGLAEQATSLDAEQSIGNSLEKTVETAEEDQAKADILIDQPEVPIAADSPDNPSRQGGNRKVNKTSPTTSPTIKQRSTDRSMLAIEQKVDPIKVDAVNAETAMGTEESSVQMESRGSEASFALAEMTTLPAQGLEAANQAPAIADVAIASTSLPNQMIDQDTGWRDQLDEAIDNGIGNLWDGARTAAASIADPLNESTNEARVIRFKVGKFQFYNRKIKKHAS